MNENVIRDVAIRTNGEIYLGVVGSVRSGKSTFIRRFMEKKVLPYVEAGLHDKIMDELPQSGDGKTIMTVEPKFVPSTNIRIETEESVAFSVRLIDCVGYITPNAKGYLNEDGSPRLVRTPWFSEEIPFSEAATIGTKKVIEAHSHIGIVITSDGSFGELKRNDFALPEKDIINDLKEVNKPFIVIVNTANPNSEETKKLVDELTLLYEVSVIALNAEKMTSKDVDLVLKESLNEFSIEKLDLQIPDWVDSLKDEFAFKQLFKSQIENTTKTYRKMKEVFNIKKELEESNLFENVQISEIDPGTGQVILELSVSDEVYDGIIASIIGEAITEKKRYLEVIQEMAEAKAVSGKVAGALKAVEQCGYGIALPNVEDLNLELPEIIKQSGRYGIKIKATAPTLYIVKVDVESSFEPIIGSQEQSQALVDHMIEDFKSHKDKIWQSEIFGRKLSDVIIDGIRAKIHALPEVVQYKYKESLSKVINHGKGGVIAIVL